MSSIIYQCLYGKQVQSSPINEAIASVVEKEFNASSSEEFKNKILELLQSPNKSSSMVLALVLGTVNYQTYMSCDDFTATGDINEETGKVTFKVTSPTYHVQRDEPSESDFMMKPDSYTEEATSQDEEKLDADSTNTNKLYVLRLLSMMKPYMADPDATLENYCLAAPEILSKLKADGKL